MSFEWIDTVSFFLFTLILYFLSMLSRRFGEVMGMKKYYYVYYIGMFFTFSGSIVMSLSAIELETNILLGYGFFSFGLTLGIITSVKYWGWLFKEIIKG